MTDHRQDYTMADCEALFVEGVRQFVDACASINAALPNEAEDAPWTVTMHIVLQRALLRQRRTLKIPPQVRLPYGQMRP